MTIIIIIAQTDLKKIELLKDGSNFVTIEKEERKLFNNYKH